MTAPLPLPPNTRVTLTGTVKRNSTRDYWWVQIDDDETEGVQRLFPRSALQVVVPPEPEWQVGDALRIDGETIVLRELIQGHVWCGNGREVGPCFIQRAWSEGRVQVLHCQNLGAEQ